MRCLLISLCLFVVSSAIALPPSRSSESRRISTASLIAGQWHSTSLSGDAVGLAVDDVAVIFHPSKQFKATVNMNLGGPSIYQGDYNAKRHKLTLHPKSGDPIKCHVSFKGSQTMIVLAEESGVTAVFKRGTAPKDSDGWF